MSATNRAALFGKIHKVLKKHYEPVIPPTDRSVLEHLLYSCVLENARHDHVDEVFARLQKSYFDWNEVRVTSVPELAEVMQAIPDAAEAAKRMKRALQSVFEKYYQFDLEGLRKAGLGKAIEILEKFNGVTQFVIDYMTQNALGGHAIPVNTSSLAILVAVDGVSESDAAKNRVPGLERAIPKNKGAEFASLLHQLAIDFTLSPQGTKVKGIIGEIDPDAKDRLPKKAPTPPPAPAPIKRVITPATPIPGVPAKPSAEKGKGPDTIPFERPDRGGDKSHADKGATSKASGDKAHAEKAHAEKGHADKDAGKKESGERGFVKEKVRLEREKQAKEKDKGAKDRTADTKAAGKEHAGKEHTGKEATGKESAGKDVAAKEHLAKEGHGKGDLKKPGKPLKPDGGKPDTGKADAGKADTGKAEAAKHDTKTKSSAGGITRKKPK